MEERDNDLRIKVQAAMQDAEWVKKVLQAKFTEDLCSLFQQKGIEISVQEVKSLVNEAITNMITELNEEELQQVSGGMRDHWA